MFRSTAATVANLRRLEPLALREVAFYREGEDIELSSLPYSLLACAFFGHGLLLIAHYSICLYP